MSHAEDEFLKKVSKFYIDDYGDETFPLLKALLVPSEKIALLNPFIETPKEVLENAQALPGIEKSFAVKIPAEIKPILKDGLLSHYFLDASSLIAPLLLPISPNSVVLDMCAAPGGKLLAMIFRQIPNVFFVASDISQARCGRLWNVLKKYVPESIIKNTIKVITSDAIKLCRRSSEKFDAVMLDAPCSSEAHVLQKSGFKKFLGPQKNLPYRQYALLCAGLIALKPAGHLGYGTCSINRAENDGVIDRLIKKKSLKIKKPKIFLGQATSHGVIVLPHQDLAGPSYVCLMQKI